MLIVEIAAGVILAVILLRLWPCLLLVALIGAALLWFDTTKIGQSKPNPGIIAGVFWGGVLVYALVQRRRRAKQQNTRV